jgi:hypothetical protein
MEAAEALSPREALLYKEGGAALETAVRAYLGEWAEFATPPSTDSWLSNRLLAALCERPDLQLTGRDLKMGIHAPRCRLQHDLLLIARKKHDPDQLSHRLSLDLDINPKNSVSRTTFRESPFCKSVESKLWTFRPAIT